MLKKLRLRFVGINMAIVLAILCTIFGVLLHTTHANLERESVDMITAVATDPLQLNWPDTASRLPYFTVRISPSGSVRVSGTSYYDLSDEQVLSGIVTAALRSGGEQGLLRDYSLRYLRTTWRGNEYIVFADVSSANATMQNLWRSCILIGLCAAAVFLAVSFLLARWAVKPVERAWTQQKQFVSDASHELKTPLASIKLLSDSILQNEMDADTMREFVADIGSEAERLNRMSQKLLMLSRREDSAGPEHEVVDVGDVVSRVFRMLVPLADDRQIDLTGSWKRGCTVLSMEDDVYQIIFNLVENGIKYNQPQGSVHVSLEKTADDVTISVEDTGFGIPEEALGHIFERFYRVDKARSRQAGGSGLGLSIVRELVQRNYGSIGVRSEVGKGTRFMVVFPYFEVEGENENAE